MALCTQGDAKSRLQGVLFTLKTFCSLKISTQFYFQRLLTMLTTVSSNQKSTIIVPKLNILKNLVNWNLYTVLAAYVRALYVYVIHKVLCYVSNDTERS